MAAVAVLAGGALVACSDDDAGDADARTSADTGHNAADVAFTQEMIPHHAQAVEMSALAADRAESAEVKSLAEDIEAAQQPEIDLMSEMLRAWGEDVPDTNAAGHEGHGSGEMPGMMSDQEMTELGSATGAEFDRMWLTMMIAHHEGAITMSEEVLANGSDAEVSELADEIIEVQQAEIATMRQLLGDDAPADDESADDQSADGHDHADDESDADDQAGAAFGHIHGLGVVDGVLHVATHYGLFSVDSGGVSMTSEDDHDFMGFTVADDGSFLASGHPNSRTDLPGHLGLLGSSDGGQTWDQIALTGEVDFHALDAKDGVVVGYDSGTAQLMRSDDRENWEQLGQYAIADVTISPDDTDTLLITAESGPMVSTDGGGSFAGIDGAPVLMFVDWPRSGELYGISPDGTVHRSSDGGTTWEAGAELGDRPQALTVAPDGSIYVALPVSIVVSDDQGASFDEHYAWTAD
ncbi:F510_1955 family glycosylhydrolase [Phytoactinopolyspora halotolerans]|uniref:F510_1955 family glycosylhydrolase n=1 Tax=Phytoactinopolyspora halotolerans TaxID=1981512 RepID=UPI001C209BC6|nr:DUF305 domain-containing protein [Phytoactinopolyspora halotolerans]